MLALIVPLLSDGVMYKSVPFNLIIYSSLPAGKNSYAAAVDKGRSSRVTPAAGVSLDCNVLPENKFFN
jgi:hypothetical protein